MKLKNGLVNIFIVNFNQSIFLEECILSILSQNYKEIELLVIDNNSSAEGEDDRVKEICTRLNVDFYLRKKDSSLTKCLNELLEKSTGEFFSAIAADDIMLSDKTTRQVEFMRKIDVKVAACFGNMIKINGKSELITASKKVGFDYYDFFRVFTSRVDLYAPTAMYRTSALKAVGGFEEDHRIEDLSIYLKLTSAGYQLVSLPYLFCLYRIHSSNTHSRYKWMMQEKIKIWNSYKSNENYKEGMRNIYLEHFSNFGSTDKVEFLKLFPKVIFKFYDKYFVIGVLRFLFDHRLMFKKN